MFTITPTITIKLEDNEYKVEDLSEEVQREVAIYDHFRQSMRDAEFDLLGRKMTLQHYSQQILRMVQKELGGKEEAVKEEVSTD